MKRCKTPSEKFMWGLASGIFLIISVLVHKIYGSIGLTLLSTYFSAQSLMEMNSPPDGSI